jgi:hypothetical protein
MMPREKMIVVENVNIPGRRTTVNARKYTAMRDVLLTVLPGKPPGFTQEEMSRAVVPHLPQDLWPNGLITRNAAVKPLRWHRADRVCDPSQGVRPSCQSLYQSPALGLLYELPHLRVLRQGTRHQEHWGASWVFAVRRPGDDSSLHRAAWLRPTRRVRRGCNGVTAARFAGVPGNCRRLQEDSHTVNGEGDGVTPDQALHLTGPALLFSGFNVPFRSSGRRTRVLTPNGSGFVLRSRFRWASNRKESKGISL